MTKEMINGLIFDLQRFVDNKDVYYGTSDSESIKVTSSGAVYSSDNSSLEKRTENVSKVGVNAGAGEDTIIVDNTAEGLNIAGGKNNDYITIDADTKGNTYVFNYGDGKDTIVGWNSKKDTLLFTRAGYQTLMSEDGKELIIKSGAHQVTFLTGTNLKYGDTIGVQTAEGGAITPITFQKLMQGTARNNEIHNDGTTTYNGVAVLNEGTSASDYWKIDAAGGNDTIHNKGRFVSISGGAGRDYIEVNKNESTLASGVTINGGAGNDEIHVENNRNDGAASDTKITGHVYEFGTADGVDSIFGYNAKDTIVLTGPDGANVASDVAVSITSRVDIDGNFILTSGATTIKIMKPEDNLLGGTKLNIQVKTSDGLKDLFDNSITNGAKTYANIATKVIDDATADHQTFHYEIPKKVLLTNSSDSPTDPYDSTYDNYSIDAASGYDYLTISGKAISVDGGIGNDYITLTGGTNVKADATSANTKYSTITGDGTYNYAMMSNDALVAADVVTVKGNAGNDQIDATSDTAVVTVSGVETTVRAAHVYEIDANGSGRDSIWGFNEYDTIKVSNWVTKAEETAAHNSNSDSTVTATAVKTIVDPTGQFLRVFIGAAELWIDISNKDYFKGGKTINIVKDNGDGTTSAIADLDTQTLTTNDVNAGYSTLTKVFLDKDDNETTKDATGDKAPKSWKYTVARKLVGTNWADSDSGKLENVDDNFIVEGKNGDDEIINVGAKDVSISGGSGNDVIKLFNKVEGTTPETVYGTGVTVNGGLGNDAIYNEYVTLTADSTETVYGTKINNGSHNGWAKADKKTKGHTYTFSAGDGNDTIYFFGDDDVIKLDSITSYLGSEVVDKTDDLLVKFSTAGGTKVTSTILLKDFVKRNSERAGDPYGKTFTILKTTNGTVYEPETIEIPRNILGTTGSDDLTNFNEEYNIEALAGNDVIFNAGYQSKIKAAAGNDTIHNIADDVSLNAGVGNDQIFIMNNSGNTIMAGAGNDSIYSYNGGGHTYYFKEGQGVNYIFGFQDGDTVSFDTTDEYTTDPEGNKKYTNIIREFTSEGVVLTLKDSNGLDSTKVIIKGEVQLDGAGRALKDAIEAASEDLKDAKNALKVAPTDQIKIDAYNTAQNTYRTAVTEYNEYLVEAAKNRKYSDLLADEQVIIQANGTEPDTFTNNEYSVPRMIVGTNANDQTNDGNIYGSGKLVVTEEMAEGYSVDAKAGNDQIVSNAAKVSISGGIGNDTIWLNDGSVQNTINGGIGNDLIFNKDVSDPDNVKENGGGKLFQYAVGDGNDTIHGLAANDSITITTADATYETVMNETGFKVNIKQNNYIVGSILIDQISSDTSNFQINSDTIKIPKNIYGTSTDDSTVLTSAANEYTYLGGNGNDAVTVAADAADVYVNTGDGSDVITVEDGAQRISLEPGYRDDVIYLNHHSTSPRTIVFNSLYQGVNEINGITSKDILFINVSDTSIVSAVFDENGFYVLTLSDYKTKIKLKGTDGTEYVRLADPTKPAVAKSFKLRMYGQDEAESDDYQIPSFYPFDSTDQPQYIINNNDVLAFGGTHVDEGNDVLVKSDDVTLETGAGDDTITIEKTADRAVITAGKGNDKIVLQSRSSHIINYKYGDGNDTITGWDPDNFLNITGTTDYQVSMTGDDGNTFALVFSNGDAITFSDIKAGDEGNKIQLIGDVTKESQATVQATLPGETIVTIAAVEVDIPKLINGTSGADELNNTVDGGIAGFTIKGMEGNDIIANSGDRTSISAGADNDLVTSEGNNVTISGGSGADTIEVFNSENSSINSGTGADVISLGAGAFNNTVISGKDNDTIYANDLNNVFVFESGHGNNTIYGFKATDTLKIVGANLLATVNNGSETVASAEATADGLVIKLTTGETITLRGKKKDTAADNATAASDFELLKKTDSFVIVTDSGNVPVLIENKVVATPNVTLYNDIENVILQGVGSDIIKNTADNVKVDAGSGHDVVFNTGNIVSISGGAGKDSIYLSTPYEIKVTDASDQANGTVKNDLVESADTIKPSASAVTINAGLGNDVIWGNDQGDYTSENQHVYEYKLGDGKDTIYGFGANDIIKISSNDPGNTAVSFTKEFKNTTKKEFSPNWQEDTNGNKLYTYEYANGDTNTYTDKTKEIDTVEKKDGTWYVKTPATDIDTSNLSSLKVFSFTTAPTSGYTVLNKYTLNGVDYYTTATSRTEEPTLYGYVKTGETFDSANLEGTTTTEKADVAKKIYQYYDATGNAKYVDNTNEITDVTFQAYLDNSNSNQPYYVKIGVTVGDDGRVTIEQINSTPGPADGDGDSSKPVYKCYDAEGIEYYSTIPNPSITPVWSNYYAKDNVNLNLDDTSTMTTELSDAAVTTSVVYKYTDASGTIQYKTDNTNETLTYTAAHTGNGTSTVYLKTGNDITDENLNDPTKWTTVQAEAVSIDTDNDGTADTPVAIRYYNNQSGIEQYTNSTKATVEGQKYMVAEWHDVDDPDYKDVVIKIGTGSIMLKHIKVGQGNNGNNETVHLSVQKADGTYESAQFYVPKEHKLATNEGTAEMPFVNDVDGENIDDGYQIIGQGRGNHVINNGEYAIINLANGGNNTIDNSGDYAQLKGSILADKITNTADGVSITAGNGENTITNDGINASIVAGIEADIITNNASGSTIEAGAGNNVIVNSGQNSAIITSNTATGDSADKVTNNQAESVLIQTGVGNDTIILDDSERITVQAGKGNNVIFSNANGGRTYVYNSEYGYGRDTIENWTESDALKLELAAGEYYTKTTDRNGVIVTICKDVTNNDVTSKQILGTITIGSIVRENGNPVTGTDDDGTTFKTTPLEGGKNIFIYTSQIGNIQDINPDSPNDYIEMPNVEYADETTGIGAVVSSKSDYKLIGNDNTTNELTNEGTSTSIKGGNLKDSIFSTGEDATIDSGDGDDLIVLAAKTDYDATNGLTGTAVDKYVTVNAGHGNDTIVANDYTSADYNSRTRTKGMVYNYAVGDGNDVIKGFSKDDTIQITGAESYTTTVDANNNFIISVGSGENAGSIKLEGYPFGKTVNIVTRINESAGFSEVEDIIVPQLSDLSTDSDHKYTNTSNNVFISGTNAAETIESKGNNVIIHAGGGNDRIFLTDNNESVQVFAGGGEDIIQAFDESGRDGVNYVFNANEGGTRIINYNANDTITFNGAWDPTADGATLIAATATEDNPNSKTIVLNFEGTRVSLQGFGTGGASDQVNVTYNTERGILMQGVITSGNVYPGTEGDDLLPNVGSANESDEFTMYGYGGRDTILNAADKVSIYGGDGNDYISHEQITGHNASEGFIYGDAGNDSIIVKGEKNYVDGGAGNDFITLKAGSGESTINMSAGTDRIQLDDDVAIAATKGRLFKVSGKDGGNTYINGFTANDSIQVTEDGITITQGAANTSFTADNYYFFRIGNHTVYLKGDGADQGDKLPIIDKDGNAWAEDKKVPYLTRGTDEGETIDSTSITAANTFVDAYGGNDYIESDKAGLTISAGAGNDTVDLSGDNVSINAAEGNDSIVITSDHATINPGTGTDTIVNNKSTSTVEYQFSSRNGITYIDGWTANTTIYFPDATTRTRPAGMTVNQDGSEMTLSANNNTIIFRAGATTFDNTTTVNVYYGADSIPVGMTENQYYEATEEERTAARSANATIKATARQLTAGEPDENGVYKVDTAIEIGSNSANIAVYTGLGEATINVGDGANNVTLNANDGYKKTINVTTSGVADAANGVKVNGSSAADTITNTSDYALINGGSGENQITNGESGQTKGAHSTINGGEVKDIITNYAADVVIYGGEGGDEITNSGSNVSIFGGDDRGNDTITHSGNGDATIFGGAGNDSIKHDTGTGKVTYYFGSNNGVNTITGYKDGDSLYFADLADRGTFYATANKDLSEVTLTSSDRNTIVLQGSVADTTTATKIKEGTTFTAVRAYAEEANRVVNVSISAVNLTDNADTDYTNVNEGITLNLGAGADEITNSAKKVVINGTQGDAKKITNNAVGTATEAVTINTGDGNDTISVGSAAQYAVLNVGEGTNSIISAGQYVTLNGGTGAEKVSISGSNSTFNVNEGADEFVIQATAANNTIYGGAGNDQVNIESGAGANVFYYEGNSAREGADTITGFGANDTISVNSSRNISATLIDTDSDETNDDVRFTFGNTTLTLAGKTSGEVKFLVEGVERTWDIAAGGWKASANVADYNLVSEDVFGDDSDAYTTDNTNSIDSIDYLGTSNYSAGNIESNDLNNLVPNNDATSATFGQDKDNQ